MADIRPCDLCLRPVVDGHECSAIDLRVRIRGLIRDLQCWSTDRDELLALRKQHDADAAEIYDSREALAKAEERIRTLDLASVTVMVLSCACGLGGLGIDAPDGGRRITSHKCSGTWGTKAKYIVPLHRILREVPRG